MKRNTSFKKIIQTISDAQNILIGCHVGPDGDALGSVLALSHSLQLLGKNAVGVFDSLDHLGAPGVLEGIKSLKTATQAKKQRYDLFISLDCGAFNRLPSSIQEIAKQIPYCINIDHHFTNPYFGDQNFVKATASSTGELIWKILKLAKWPIDRITAEALWTAIITDTGRYAYDSTSPATMLCGADLLRYGVRTAWLNDRIYCSFPPPAIELKRRAFKTLDFTPDRKIAWISLLQKDFQEAGGSKADAEDAIEIPRSIENNQIALFFYSDLKKEDLTHVSIRTRAPLDASGLAACFGGGGHMRAAGCTISQPLNEAKKVFFKTLKTWLKK